MAKREARCEATSCRQAEACRLTLPCLLSGSDTAADVSVVDSLDPADQEETVTSKFLPPKCSNCGADWSGADSGGEDPVVRLGAHVWQCRTCGRVHILGGAGDNRISSYRT